jgi:hypothetical protein
MTLPSSSPEQAQVDVRGPRFAAWVTTAVLAVVLLTSWWPLLALQAVVFAYSAAVGPRRSPYGQLFAKLVAPRIGPPSEREPVAPLRFAQLVGFVFAVLGVLGYAAGIPLLGPIATGFALAAALLNAAFGICLGCMIYPYVARLRRTTAAGHL